MPIPSNRGSSTPWTRPPCCIGSMRISSGAFSESLLTTRTSDSRRSRDFPLSNGTGAARTRFATFTRTRVSAGGGSCSRKGRPGSANCPPWPRPCMHPRPTRISRWNGYSISCRVRPTRARPNWRSWTGHGRAEHDRSIAPAWLVRCASCWTDASSPAGRWPGRSWSSHGSRFHGARTPRTRLGWRRKRQ